MLKRKHWLASAALLTGAVLALTGCSSPEAGNADDTGSSDKSADLSAIPTLEELFASSESEPPREGPAPAAGKNVWWITCSSIAAACLDPAEAGAEAAELLGWDYTIADGKWNEGGAWGEAIRTAIADGADGIVLDGISCPAVQQPLEEAKAAGVLVIGVQGNDCDEAGQGGPSLFTADMVFTDTIKDNTDLWIEYGRQAAYYLIRATDGNAKVIWSEGAELQQALVNDGFREVIEASCPGCELVATVPYASPDLVPDGPWIQALRTALVQHPDATAVWIPFDVMSATLGGVAAVEQAGVDAIVFGGQGLPDSLDMIRDGRFTAATGAQPAGWTGYATLDNLNRAFAGESAVSQGLGYAVIDIDHNLPSAPGEGYAGTLDWKSAYLESWGVK